MSQPTTTACWTGQQLTAGHFLRCRAEDSPRIKPKYPKYIQESRGRVRKDTSHEYLVYRSCTFPKQLEYGDFTKIMIYCVDAHFHFEQSLPSFVACIKFVSTAFKSNFPLLQLSFTLSFTPPFCAAFGALSLS